MCIKINPITVYCSNYVGPDNNTARILRTNKESPMEAEQDTFQVSI